jgi:hypothetical protein
MLAVASVADPSPSNLDIDNPQASSMAHWSHIFLITSVNLGFHEARNLKDIELKFQPAIEQAINDSKWKLPDSFKSKHNDKVMIE